MNLIFVIKKKKRNELGDKYLEVDNNMAKLQSNKASDNSHYGTALPDTLNQYNEYNLKETTFK